MQERFPRRARNLDDTSIFNVDSTSVIAVAVSDYEYLVPLAGPGKDLELVRELWANNPATSLYTPMQFTALANPTVDELRSTIVEYAASRTARGDILIFYFFGHGCVIGSNGFGFCTVDTQFGLDGSGVLSLSVLNFRDVVQTLASVDVHPVFIIDACFSAATAQGGIASVSSAMQDNLQIYTAGSYGLLCSSNDVTVSLDTAEGGVFTRAMYSILTKGLNERQGRLRRLLTVRDLAVPLQERLTQEGHPLSRCYVGPDLPDVPLTRNVQFKEETETFAPYMKRIVEYLWNEGNPREARIQEFVQTLGLGAYANHSKLSLPPWQLLEDGSAPQTRRLTLRGVQFVQGNEQIPRRIHKHPISEEWVMAPSSPMITIEDI